MNKCWLLLTLLTLSGQALATHGYVECEVDAFTAKGTNILNENRVSEIELLKKRIPVEELSHIRSLKASAGIDLSGGVAVAGEKMQISYIVFGALGPENKELYPHNNGRLLELSLEVDGKKANASGMIIDGGSISTSLEIDQPGWFRFKVTSVRLNCKLNN